MPVISTRISHETEEDLKRFIENENIEMSGALRKLLISGLNQWKVESSIKLLSDGRISFNRAAELAGMDPWEFSEVLRREGVTWVTDEWASEDLE